MTFGEKLKQFRTDQQLTQQALADELHIARGTVSSWENGRTYPDLTMVVRISDTLNASLDILLREDKDMLAAKDLEVKQSHKRKNWIVVLSIVVAILVLIGGFQLWNSQYNSHEVSVTQLSNLKTTVKGDHVAFAANAKDVRFYQKANEGLEMNIDKNGVVTISFEKSNFQWADLTSRKSFRSSIANWQHHRKMVEFGLNVKQTQPIENSRKHVLPTKIVIADNRWRTNVARYAHEKVIWEAK